jgi:hypothetical protein
MTGYKSKKAAALDKLEQWDCEAFNAWWDSDYDDSTNPYEINTFAYWAWAGWQAAAQPAQEPVAHQFQTKDGKWHSFQPQYETALEEGRFPIRALYTTPPQRTWVGLTDESRKQLIQEGWSEYIAGIDDGKTFGEWMSVATEAKLKEKNT